MWPNCHPAGEGAECVLWVIGSPRRSHEAEAFTGMVPTEGPKCLCISSHFLSLFLFGLSFSLSFSVIPTSIILRWAWSPFPLKGDISQTSALSSRAERASEWKWSGSESVHKQRPIWRCTQTRPFDLTAVSATLWRPIPPCCIVQPGHACFQMTRNYKADAFSPQDISLFFVFLVYMHILSFVKQRL